jgi:hypothetical protein
MRWEPQSHWPGRFVLFGETVAIFTQADTCVLGARRPETEAARYFHIAEDSRPLSVTAVRTQKRKKNAISKYLGRRSIEQAVMSQGSALKMEAVWSVETSTVSFHQIREP